VKEGEKEGGNESTRKRKGNWVKEEEGMRKWVYGNRVKEEKRGKDWGRKEELVTYLKELSLYFPPLSLVLFSLFPSSLSSLVLFSLFPSFLSLLALFFSSSLSFLVLCSLFPSSLSLPVLFSLFHSSLFLVLFSLLCAQSIEQVHDDLRLLLFIPHSLLWQIAKCGMKEWGNRGNRE